MRALHEERGSRVTIFLVPVNEPRAYGLVETSPDGRLLRFREKPGPDEPLSTNMINAGIYLIDAALLGRMPRGRPVSIEREFFPAIIADGIPSFGWSARAYWRDIGNPAAYHAAQIDLLERRVRTELTPPGQLRGGSWVATPQVAPEARIESPSVVGAGVRLGKGAHVGPHAIIGADSAIGADARVRNAVVWERVHIGEGAVVRDCVVGADAIIGARAELGGCLALESGAVVAAGERRWGSAQT
jgi:NDP-sugar pyrophosphorylase family protein